MRLTRIGLASALSAALLLAGELGGQTPAQDRVLALVGGTLIDGHGGPPIRNSVILVAGERIRTIGTVGSLRFRAVPR